MVTRSGDHKLPVIWKLTTKQADEHGKADMNLQSLAGCGWRSWYPRHQSCPYV